MIEFSKISPKGQTTIPRNIRAALKVKPGDLLEWEVSASRWVEVRRVRPVELVYLRALEGTLGEWADPEDEKAFCTL